MPLTPAEEVAVRRMIADAKQYGIKKGVIAPLTLTTGIDGQKFGISRSALDTSSGSNTLLVPLARIEVAPPATGCDDLDDCVRQCWGPFYWCRVVSRVDGDCGDWTCGDCAFLEVVDGLPIPLGVPIPGWLIGSPPAAITGAALPVGFECAEADLANSPLYGVYAGDRSYMAVPGEDAGWCEAGGGRIHAKVCDLFVWVDCSGWLAIGPGYMGDINGCATPPVIRQMVHFERMLSGDEFDEEGDPRACAPLFTYKRERNQQIRLACEGGELNVYGPDPADACGDTEVFLYQAGCCECDEDDGGTGGSGCCEDETWPASSTFAFVPGAGYVPASWSGADGVFYAIFFAPGCGTPIVIRFDPDTCESDYSCDTINLDGPWVPLTTPLGWAVTCGELKSAGPYDTLDPDSASAGCSENGCTTINGIYWVTT